jgi:hypothetical protein
MLVGLGGARGVHSNQHEPPNERDGPDRARVRTDRHRELPERGPTTAPNAPSKFVSGARAGAPLGSRDAANDSVQDRARDVNFDWLARRSCQTRGHRARWVSLAPKTLSTCRAPKRADSARWGGRDVVSEGDKPHGGRPGRKARVSAQPGTQLAFRGGTSQTSGRRRGLGCAPKNAKARRQAEPPSGFTLRRPKPGFSVRATPTGKRPRRVTAPPGTSLASAGTRHGRPAGGAV